MKIFISESVISYPPIPNIVYHGQAPKYIYMGNGKTKRILKKFSEFNDKNKRFIGKDDIGYYFTPNKRTAIDYAENGYVYTCSLNIENPYYWENSFGYDNSGLIKNPNFIKKSEQKLLESKGYDGVVILDFMKKIGEIVAFYPSQITILEVE